MNRRGFVVVLLVVAVVAACGCSGRSEVVIGGDPSGGTISGGAFAMGGDTTAGATTGGVFPTGGVEAGGTFPTGGAPYGGTGALGGSVTGGGGGYGGTGTLTGGSVNGGTSTLGGTSGSGTAEGGEAGFDPYPPVAWENGQGYRNACPRYGDFWGFTCWNYETDTRSCKPSGDPYCNACSCSAPCQSAPDCPYSVTGARADCIASATTAKSCFVVCDDTECPTGMTCTPYPGAARRVCVWVSEPTYAHPEPL